MRWVLLGLFPFILSCTPEDTERLSAEPTKVRYVIDGDTLETSLGRVRIIGIDAPEFEECFFEEARAELRRFIGKQSVRLIADPSSDDRDKYDRLLRYVEFQGKDIGAELVGNGFARVFPWFPFERLEAYESLAGEARKEERGLWTACPA